MNPNQPSPFQAGEPLPGNHPSYITRTADERLERALERGDYCCVMGGPRTGKTSLLWATATRLKEKKKKAIESYYVDLKCLRSAESKEQCWNEIFGEMRISDLDALEIGGSVSADRLENQLIAAFEKIARGDVDRVVVFLDRMEVLRELGFGPEWLLAPLKECLNRRSDDDNPDKKVVFGRLTFCFAIRGTRESLATAWIDDPLQKAIPIRLEEGDKKKDRKRLIETWQGAFPDFPAKECKKIICAIFAETQGHPYLSQLIADEFRRRFPKPKSGSLWVQIAQRVTGDYFDSEINTICRDLFFSPAARHLRDELIVAAQEILEVGAIGTKDDLIKYDALIRFYWSIRKDQRRSNEEIENPLALALRSSGLVRAEGGHYLVVANRIFDQLFDEEWISEQLQGDEIFRWSYEFERGQETAKRRARWRFGVPLFFGVVVVVWALASRESAVSQKTLDQQSTIRELSKSLLDSTNQLIEARSNHNVIRGKWDHRLNTYSNETSLLTGQVRQFANDVKKLEASETEAKAAIEAERKRADSSAAEVLKLTNEFANTLSELAEATNRLSQIEARLAERALFDELKNTIERALRERDTLISEKTTEIDRLKTKLAKYQTNEVVGQPGLGATQEGKIILNGPQQDDSTNAPTTPGS